MRDPLIRAIDKRARDRIVEHDARRTFAIGTVEGVTLAGASVKLDGSKQYLSNVTAMQGTDLVQGARVLLARVTRHKWVILGAVEVRGAVTNKTGNTEPMAAPANFSAADLETGAARLEWDASYFDVHLYELQVGSISDGDHSDTDTLLVDNSQYEYVDSDATYYARVRAVGQDWYRSAYTGWLSFSITSTGLNNDHGSLIGLGDDDHTLYLLADGTRDLDGDLTVTGDASILTDLHVGGDSYGLAAKDIAFTPNTLTDWDSDTDPGETNDALDQLAERVDDLEGAGSTGDASDITYTPGDASDWDGDLDPGDVDDALDQLADRLDGLKASDLVTYMEPVTNGDVSDPELVFALGDVIMAEVAF